MPGLVGARQRGPLGIPLLALAMAGLAVAGYLLVQRLVGAPPVCGPVKGCETVTLSEYSQVLGFPVAALGFGYSALLVAASAAWWWLADRRALLGAYGLGLLGTLAVAYLTYLELFVIHAVCAWCVSYALTMVLALAVSGLALLRG